MFCGFSFYWRWFGSVFRAEVPGKLSNPHFLIDAGSGESDLP